MSAPSTPAPPSPAPPSPPDRWYPAAFGECPPLPEVSGSEHPSSEPAESDTSGGSGGERVCKGCDKVFPLADFNKKGVSDKYGREYRSFTCKTCRHTAQKLIRHLRKIIGEPLDRCEICERIGPVVCDHDHQTDEFRGWLCSTCNRGLGHLGDNAAGLRRALAYLEMPRSGASSSRASPY